MRIRILIVVLLLFWVNGFTQTVPSPNENYIYSTVYLNESGTKKMETIQYMDGLGRPKQSINIKGSAKGQDLIIPIEYDSFGKQVKNYLPLPKASLNGAIQPIDGTNVNIYYDGIYNNVPNAYFESVYDDSPLHRLKQSAFPGQQWAKNSGHSVKYDYDANLIFDGVKKFTANTTWTNNVAYTTVTSTTYSSFELFKRKVADEDDNISYVFTNKLGQKVLIRKINLHSDGKTTGTLQEIDTYYIYNEYNQLVCVVPPLAAKITLTQDVLDKLCYQYRYDDQGRLVEKKLPGKGFDRSSNKWIWDSFVYDQQDRLVAMQDSNLKLQGNKWLYTQYDQFSRPVATGICNAFGTSREDEQNFVDTKGSNNTTRNNNIVINYSGMDVYYNIATSYPQSSKVTALLSLNYYDTYPTGTPTVASQILGQEVLSTNAINSNISTKSFPTASFVKNISEDKWTKSYVWYDTMGRSIAANSANHLGGFTTTETELDFVGMPKKTITKNSRTSSIEPNVTIEENFTYDDQYRLKKHEHEVIGKSPKETLAEYIYDDIGQLIVKKVGGNAGTPLQIVNYRYNIRGWLTDINDLDSLNINNHGDLFAYKIRYDTIVGLTTPNVLDYPDYKVRPRYNGNISEVDWISLNYPGEIVSTATYNNRYGYVYDGLNRLKAGFYQHSSRPAKGEFNEIVEEYDMNGNIGKLKRFAHKAKSSTPAKIDDLVYYYDGNQLTSIIDNPIGLPNPAGYEGGGATIKYDSNGNMIVMPDKGITNIAYNFLDLPSTVDQRGNSTQYTYRADGVKLKRKFTLNNAVGSTITTTDYLEGFHYSEASNPLLNRALDEKDDVTQSIRTAGEEEVFVDEYGEANRIALPNDPPLASIGLMFFPTAEGFYDFRRKQYIYQYKDQVGNTRLSYWVHPDENILKVLDRNDYYPFGMNISQLSEFSATTSPLNYKFGGKELQESGMYDFGARTYMPDVGRWMSIDPLAELSPDLTPFRFAFNNPISFTDPTGMYEDDYDDFAGHFDIDFSPDNWNSSRSDFWNILNFRWDIDIDIRSGSHNASGSQDDFMADMASEYSSEANESGSQVEQNCCMYQSLTRAILPRISIPIIEGSAIRLAGLWALPLMLNGDAADTSDPSKRDNTLILYRGVYVDHPDYANALKGKAVPRSGNATPKQHNEGESRSNYTSWTIYPSVADKFGGRKGRGGVVLTKTFKWSEITPSPDKFQQGELLIRGVVTGAIVTPATPNPKK